MLYVVHCVDTEGPLWESLDETFLRVKAIYGKDIEPTADNLHKLQNGLIDFGSEKVNAAVALTFSSGQLSFMRDWTELEAMLDRLDRPERRMAVPDSRGGGWHVNWHCLAHFGFDPEKNPRRRDLGVHNIFDRYTCRYRDSALDSIHWHFHPLPVSRQANHCATAYFSNPAIFEIISRRVLERLWFPCVNRPGFHSERPDSHWFLEQWMPFDIANNNCQEDTFQPDLNHGRFGDWRRATSDWEIYNPHHDDYQRPGQCRRHIARCLMLEGRLTPLTPNEIERAFIRAQSRPTVMAFANHDFRDMESGMDFVQQQLRAFSLRYPHVEWVYSDAAQAMRGCLGLEAQPHTQIKLSITPTGPQAHQLSITLDQPPFGPQPWFCYERTDGSVHHDNLDRTMSDLGWTYTFDAQTSELSQIKKIGCATNTHTGRTSVSVIDMETGKQHHAVHN